MDLAIWFVYISSLYLAIFWLLVLIRNRFEPEEEKKDEIGAYSPRVSVIVPAYNEEKGVGKCIESLLNIDYPKKLLEIIVVNDGSKDGTKRICESFGKKIRLINIEKNSGTKAVPMNIGLDYATGEVIACLDSDSIVSPDALKKMLPYFSDPKVGAVTPALKVYEPKTFMQKLQWFEYLFAIFLRKLMSFIDCIYVTPGPFSIYRAEVFEKVGKFDEKNITEDMEMALRLQSEHYKIKNAIDAFVYTIAPKNKREMYKQRRRWYTGLLYNALKYKYLFFNRKYGDFGVLMPMNVFSVFIVMLSTSIFAYYLLKPAFINLTNMMLVDFDIMTYLKVLELDILLLDFDIAKVLIVILVFIFGIITLTLSHMFSKEPLRFGTYPVILFMLFYFMFLGAIWIGVIAETVLGGGIKRRW